MNATLAPLPCPFCGSTDISTDDARDFVSCSGCYTEGPCNPGMGSAHNIEAWNTRAALAQQPAQPVAGMVLAPAEPTDAMLRAFGSDFVADAEWGQATAAEMDQMRREFASGYRAMMAAAPTAQQAAPATTYEGEPDMHAYAARLERTTFEMKARIEALDMERRTLLAQQAAPAHVDLYEGLTLNQVKANLSLLKEDDLRGLVVSLLIMKRIAEKYAAPAQARQPLTSDAIDDILHTKHFDRQHRKSEFDRGLCAWWRMGVRDGEAAHGITAPTGGAA